jgi:hypothetical protein
MKPGSTRDDPIAGSPKFEKTGTNGVSYVPSMLPARAARLSYNLRSYRLMQVREGS